MTERLPIVASDNNAWGTILNGYLGVGHNADGTLKSAAISTGLGYTPVNKAGDTGVGSLVFGNTTWVKGRNSTNSADLNMIRMNSSNQIELGKPTSLLDTALSTVSGLSAFAGNTSFGQLAFVEGTSAAPVTGLPMAPQTNYQRYVKPNGDTYSSANHHFSCTRYGTNAAGDGDLFDLYNMVSIIASDSTALPTGDKHGIIGAGFFAHASGTATARMYGMLSLVDISGASQYGFACELDAVNHSGGTAADVTFGIADRGSIGLNIAGFSGGGSSLKNSTAVLIQTSGVDAQFLQGITFWPAAVASGGYLLNGPGMSGAHVLRTGDISILVGSAAPEGSVSAPVGSTYHRTGGGEGTTLYHKMSGTGNTGWRSSRIVGGTTAAVGASLLEIQNSAAADGLVVFGNFAGSSNAQSVIMTNASGNTRWFVSGGSGSFLTGTTAGDGGIQVATSGKKYHIGGTSSVIAVGNDNKLSFFNAATVAQAAAYTQTYSTADRTHANFTSSNLTGISSSTTGSALAEPSGTYTQSEMQQNFRRIQDQFVLLRADLDDVKQLANALIDDHQAYGLCA